MYATKPEGRSGCREKWYADSTNFIAVRAGGLGWRWRSGLLHHRNILFAPEFCDVPEIRGLEVLAF